MMYVAWRRWLTVWVILTFCYLIGAMAIHYFSMGTLFLSEDLGIFLLIIPPVQTGFLWLLKRWLK